MARFRLLTPDAQYQDDAVIERRTAGPGVDWEIFRERDPAMVTPEAWAGCDAMGAWHEIEVDGPLLDRSPRCRLAVETAMLYLRDGKLRNLVNAPARRKVRAA